MGGLGMNGFGQKRKSYVKKPPKPVTAGSLQWLSKRHLERYVSSEAQLRRVLLRRIDRRVRAFPEDDREALVALAEAEVKRCLDNGLLNDQRVAQLWVEQLRNRGDSKLAIQQKLRQKGFSAELVSQALEARDAEQEGESALLCAILYAKRRGLGPFRRNQAIRSDRSQKDIAAMMRAGHSYDHCRQIIHCDDIDALIEQAEYGE